MQRTIATRPTDPVAALILLILAVVLSAVVPARRSSAESRSTTPTVRLVLAHRGIDLVGAANLQPGYTKFVEQNNTNDDHAIQLARLHKGVTPEQFRTALSSPDGLLAFPLAEWFGGVDDIPHHTTFTMTVRLDPGRYVLFDHAQGPKGPDGPAWFTLPRYLRTFTVDGARTGAKPPKATKVEMVNYGFAMPATLPRHGELAAVNTSDESHMAAMMRLAPGVTIAKAIETVQQGKMPKGTPLELFGTVSPGRTLYRSYDLPAGNYIIACFMPDFDDHNIPHVAKGMIAGFTIR